MQRKKSKYLLFADDVKVCISDSKASIRVLLWLINTFSKVTRFKENSHNSLGFPYTDAKGARKKSGKHHLSP